MFNPIAGIGAEASVHIGVEPFDGTKQSQVALFDQILQGQAFAGVPASDVDDEPQIGAHHAIASGSVALRNAVGEFLLIISRQQGGFVDLTEICFQRRLQPRGWSFFLGSLSHWVGA